MVGELSTESVNVINPSEDCNICHADLFEIDSKEGGKLCIMAECNHYRHKKMFCIMDRNSEFYCTPPDS